MPGSPRRWKLYIEQNGNVEMWARAQPHSGAFPELPCDALLGSFFVPETQARCHMHTGIKGDPDITLGSSGCVGLLCLGRGPGTEMSSPQSESWGGGSSWKSDQNAGCCQARVRPGLAGQESEEEVAVRQKAQRCRWKILEKESGILLKAIRIAGACRYHRRQLSPVMI